MSEPALGEYRAKRSFDRTPEPPGVFLEPRAERRWVIQLHAARRLHYDFRLEAEGVLISWAVPKGPSYDPAVKRLAVRVEDHPLEYRNFEGAIPRGNYGAGGVIIWDEGTYRDLTTVEGRPSPLAEAVAAGHASFWLEGTKLVGGWSLTRFDGANWALVKRRDERAAPARDVVSEQPRSVRSGRTLDEVVGDTHDRPPASAPRVAGAIGGEMAAAAFISPMLAHNEPTGLAETPALLAAGAGGTGGWLYEPKLDGLRCLAVRNGDEVLLWSRNRLSFTGRFPTIVGALRRLPAVNFVIDAEVVGMVDGRSDFAALQQGKAPVQLWAFDLPWLLGQDLRHLAIEQRKVLLAKTLTEGPELRLVHPLEGEPDELFKDACRRGWEGLVAKRAGSRYRAGRSLDWRKLKCGCRQELVVGGFTVPRGSREGFGALLLGYWDGGELAYAGKVGTGFSRAELDQLHRSLTALERARSPFRSQDRTEKARWVEPELVVEVEFGNWTPDGRLRHPRFIAVRPDKAAAEVHREA